MVPEYDVVIIGAGAGGGVAACVLAEAGKKVLLLERGRNLAYGDIRRDHLRNQRLSMYGHNAGPDLEGLPRVAVDAEGVESILRPHENGYHNNASCVGGGTRVYGAQAWRYMPQDFRMASLYGKPEGSSLADWPISYEDLEPYYERAEWEIGVAGESGADLLAGPRKRAYPMPAIPDNLQRQALKRGASKAGINAFPVPMLINTVERHGHAACVRCGSCIGFGCPSDSRNGTFNTVIPRALATGRCELVEGAVAEKIIIGSGGLAEGVSYLVKGEKRVARARAVVSSAGAIESARLLMLSGVESDNLGRNLQGHYYPGACGIMPESVFDNLGPGVSIATTQFNHGNEGVIGGAMLANEFVKMPILHQKWCWDPDVPRWGKAAKDYMRRSYTHMIQIQGPVHEIPNPDSRVELDSRVKDRWGLPVARLSGVAHRETVRTAEFMRHRAEDWLKASGAERVWSYEPGFWLSAGQHQAGTCRMGTDPSTSVTDPYGRVHGHENLFVMDAGLHVTNGGFNPVLTIMALAYRNAEHLSKHL